MRTQGDASGTVSVSVRTSTSGRIVAFVGFVTICVAALSVELHMLQGLGRHQGPGALVVFGLVLVASLLGTGIVHELGHVALALVARLPVAHVSLRPARRGKPGSGYHVRVKPDPAAAALPLRMILFVLGGPVANLAVALVFLRAAEEPGIGQLRHSTLLLPAIVSAVTGIGNLIPTGRIRGGLPDGTRIWLWSTRPARMREALVGKKEPESADPLRPHLVVLQNGGVPDLAALRALVDGRDRALAARSGPVLMTASARAGEQEFATDVERLARVARDPAVAPAVAGDIAGSVAWFRITQLIRTTLRDRTPLDEAQVADIEELAQFGYANHRERAMNVHALALAWLIQERFEEARKLLVGSELADGSVQDLATGRLVRAMAEAMMGDIPQAWRLIEQVRQSAGRHSLLSLAEAMTQAAERRRQGS